MTAAYKVLDAALKLPDPVVNTKQTFRPQQISTIPRSARTRDMRPKIRFESEGSAYLPQNFNFVADGEYVLRLRGWGTKVGGEFPKVVFRVDGRDVGTATVDAPADK